MSTEKLSKPVAWIIGEESIEEFKRGYETFVVRGDDVDSTEETMKLYSQEYVSALLAELEATRKQSQELAKQCGRLGARAAIAERKLATPVWFKVGTDSVDSSDRNQPGMVVAVHVDAGDFVKVKGQVYEVKEACFDDHDVTLWFVCGEVLKCAAGCQIEVVSAPEGDA
ncbi:hypothetical protein V6294_15860 [Serratia marcescens]|uniref:hypothetical protein n=1 Tax=Serratia marcescens TaxID=615 RepID=UPI003B89A967